MQFVHFQRDLCSSAVVFFFPPQPATTTLTDDSSATEVDTGSTIRLQQFESHCGSQLLLSAIGHQYVHSKQEISMTHTHTQSIMLTMCKCSRCSSDSSEGQEHIPGVLMFEPFETLFR